MLTVHKRLKFIILVQHIELCNMALTDPSGFDMLYHHTELAPVPQSECIILVSNEVDATLCSQCTADPQIPTHHYGITCGIVGHGFNKLFCT